MKTISAAATLVLTLSLISGCAKPDRVLTVKSPTDGVFYTVETLDGHGAVDSDFTRVYAHFEHDGKSGKALVVDGTYLEISKFTWRSPQDVTLCMQAGFTNSFRSEVTLRAGDASFTIHNNLQQHCKPSSLN